MRGHWLRIPAVRRLAASLRAALRAWWAAPLPLRIVIGAVIIIVTFFAMNWLYQTIRKPTEMFFPVSSALNKTPHETWRQYGPLFQKHSTAVITPELLAALAQLEGGGNPVAQTYWRWQLARNPFRLYRPASSAVGMYQITDDTFQQGKRYCIHNHVVVRIGQWHDMKSCWFNSVYTRIVPGHAIELTAALLDAGVAETIQHHHIVRATLRQKQDLAAVIHLCGAKAGDAYVRRGFRLTVHQRCGDHDVTAYLVRVNTMTRHFARLATTAPAAGSVTMPH
jgi:hypothetical protein